VTRIAPSDQAECWFDRIAALPLAGWVDDLRHVIPCWLRVAGSTHHRPRRPPTRAAPWLMLRAAAELKQQFPVSPVGRSHIIPSLPCRDRPSIRPTLRRLATVPASLGDHQSRRRSVLLGFPECRAACRRTPSGSPQSVADHVSSVGTGEPSACRCGVVRGCLTVLSR
jgi:hypothetical protein